MIFSAIIDTVLKLVKDGSIENNATNCRLLTLEGKKMTYVAEPQNQNHWYTRNLSSLRSDGLVFIGVCDQIIIVFIHFSILFVPIQTKVKSHKFRNEQTPFIPNHFLRKLDYSTIHSYIIITYPILLFDLQFVHNYLFLPTK